MEHQNYNASHGHKTKFHSYCHLEDKPMSTGYRMNTSHAPGLPGNHHSGTCTDYNACNFQNQCFEAPYHQTKL